MSQHSRESVLLWLTSVSSPEDAPVTPRGKKRRRRPLAEQSPIMMNSLPTRTPSPSKRRKLQQANLDDDGGDEDTPQPLPSIQSARDVSQQSSFSPRSLNTSSRSRSPTKEMTRMLLAPQPILFKQLMPRAPDELPVELNAMLDTIELRFSRGIAVVSEAHRSEIAKMTDFAFSRIDDFAFTQLSQLPGPSPTPEQCAKAVWLARRCEENRCCEAAWNSSVHNFVLDLAIHHAEFREKVYFLNCTSARIAPPSLIPSGKAGTALNSRMIDFAIHTEPSKRFIEAVRERAQLSTADMSVNHTLHEPLCWRPIGVSIETKHTGQNWDDAMVQVGIWTAAQFTKLEQLVKETDEISGKQRNLQEEPESRLPFLPVIIVQGHDWNFLTAVKGPNRQTYLYHKVTFGSTASPLGVYQVVATIQLLVRWVRDSFTPWFERSCLNMSEDTMPSMD